MLLCLGEPPVRFLCCCHLLICRCSSFCCCSSHCFSTSSLIRGLSPGFLHPILYFQPSPSQSDSQHFRLFNHSVLAASATALSEHFLPTDIFYVTLLSDIFGTTCFYQGFPGSRKLFPEICRASY